MKAVLQLLDRLDSGYEWILRLSALDHLLGFLGVMEAMSPNSLNKEQINSHALLLKEVMTPSRISSKIVQ